MKKARIAINGFGRIGRAFFRMAYDRPEFEIVAVNDLGDIHNLAYLLQYDTVYGRFPDEVRAEEGAIVVGDTKVTFCSEKEPTKLPWKDLGIDIVIESTGIFTAYEKAKVHLDAGARRVVISAPVKESAETPKDLGATVLMCVNDDDIKNVPITSNASCTTNAASPLVGILKKTIGIEKALLSTTHAYTASQSIVDGPKKDFREGRAAAQNIVPTSTGAAIATAIAHTELAGKFDGISLRVPVPVGSIVDVTFLASRDTTAEEVNDILRSAAAGDEWGSIFAVTEEPVVSSDIIGAHYASIADLAFTRVVGGNLVKVLAWYDNETSYTHTLVMHAAKVAEYL